MSCGRPHETDCREVLEGVYLYLDGELDEERQQLLRRHLDECSPCLRQYGLEQEVKALVARHCGNDHAPVYLRERVVAALRSVTVTVTRREYRAD